MKTKDRITKLLSKDPQLTYAELGIKCGISKQAVEQQIKRHGLSRVRKVTKRPCHGGCGRELYYSGNKTGWCNKCKPRKTYLQLYWKQKRAGRMIDNRTLSTHNVESHNGDLSS